MNVTEWLDVCPLSVYSVQSDILHEARRRENTHLNTHRYLLLQGGTMRFQSADSSFTLHPGDVLFTPSGYHYSYLLSEDARYTNVSFSCTRRRNRSRTAHCFSRTVCSSRSGRILKK